MNAAFGEHNPNRVARSTSMVKSFGNEKYVTAAGRIFLWSPVMVGDRIYASNVRGNTFLFEVTPRPSSLALHFGSPVREAAEDFVIVVRLQYHAANAFVFEHLGRQPSGVRHNDDVAFARL